MDYGCGDGGFLNALRQHETLKGIRFEGIDNDERAISWARLFAADDPGLQFHCGDVAALEPETFDSGTLIEVLEHIPPDETAGFIRCVAASLERDSELLVTVPSTEVPVSDKHYRHFTFETLRSCFEDEFEVVKCFGFERKSVVVRALMKVMMGGHFYMETSFTTDWFMREITRKHHTLRGCRRVGLVARRR